MNDISNCPNCKTELKSGLMSSIKLLDSDETNIINEYIENKSDGYCSKCGKELYRKHKDKITDEIKVLISVIPVY